MEKRKSEIAERKEKSRKKARKTGEETRRHVTKRLGEAIEKTKN